MSFDFQSVISLLNFYLIQKVGYLFEIVKFILFIATNNTLFFTNFNKNYLKASVPKPVEIKPQDNDELREKLLETIENGQLKPEQPPVPAKESKIKLKHFDFLDGYRGLCAILVVLQHSVSGFGIGGDYTSVYNWGSWLGVFGFFVLSSFLLTYRFVKELDNRLSKYYSQATFLKSYTTVDQSSGLMSRFKAIDYKSIVNELKIFSFVTIKYGLRRFFRIYVALIIFTKDTQTIYLRNLGYSHLWTMPPEIRYYFLIPLIGLIFVKFKRYVHVLSFLGYMIIFLNEKYQYWPYEVGHGTPTGGKLRAYFMVFFSGSLAAVVYYYYFESNKLIKEEWFQRRYPKLIIECLSYLYFVILFYHYGEQWKKFQIFTDYAFIYVGLPPLRLFDHLNAGISFSFLLLAMVISAPNKFTKLFSESIILTYLGKYSFGLYLWHMQNIPKVGRLGKYCKTQFEILALMCIYSYAYGFAFFYTVENPLMNLANYLCFKVESLRFFKVKNEGA